MALSYYANAWDLGVQCRRPRPGYRYPSKGRS